MSNHFYTEKLSKIYSVLAYDPTEKVFLIEDRKKSYLGGGFICEPLAGGDEGVFERLHVFINQDMPVDSVIQFSLLASPYIDNILAENKLISSLNSKGSMLRAIMDKRTKFLENLRDSSNDYNLVRNFSLIVTIMVPCSNHIPAENEFHKMEQLLRVSGENLKTVRSIFQSIR